MKKLLLFLALAIAGLSQTAQPVQKGGAAGTNNLTGDFNIGPGRTVTVASGGTLVVASGGTFTPGTGSINWSAITGTPTTLSGYGITDPVVLTSGSYANPSWITSLAAGIVSGVLVAGNMPAYTGDVTSGSGATVNTLATVNGSPGTVGSGTAIPVITVTAKGLVTVTSTAVLTPAWSNITGTPTSADGYGIVNGANIDAWGAKAIPTGTVVGTSDAQALTSKTYNGLTLTAASTGFTIAGGTTSKTLTMLSSLGFSGTDSSTLNIGTGGTLGSAAFTSAGAYEVPLTFSTGLTRTTNTITVNTSQNIATLSNLTSNGVVFTSGGNGTLGVTGTSGAGNVVLVTGATLVGPALGTPTALVGTNITGTASGLTAGNVTTNANLTGPITSSGNATALAAQTGTGTTFVVQTSPTLITPTLGVATATSLNGLTFLTNTPVTDINVFGGVLTGNATNAGEGNTGFGSSVLRLITGYAAWNTGFGDGCMQSMTTALWNTGLGSGALASHITGDSNTAVGADTLYQDQTGSGNTALGHFALYSNINGASNVGLGVDAIKNITHGSQNVGIGLNTLQAVTTASGNVAIGYESGYWETGSNKFFVDNTNRANEADGRVKALVYGVFDAATANQRFNINAVLNVSETGTIGGTFTAGTAKPVVLDGGNGYVTTQGVAGGWQTGYLFKDSGGTIKGGVWGNGSGTVLSNILIGDGSASSWATFTSTATTLPKATSFTAAVASTSTTTGSAIVTGGIGVSGAAWIGDIANIAGIVTIGDGKYFVANGHSGTTTLQAGSGGNALGYLFKGSAGTAWGGLWVSGTSDTFSKFYIGDGAAANWFQFTSTDATAAGTLHVSSTTDSTSITTGGVILAGGLGVAKTITALHYNGGGTAPTAAVGTGAGTSPSAVTVTGHDAAGNVSLTTGTLPTAAGTVLTLTFNTAYNSAPHVVLQPANAATALLSGATMVYVTSTTTTFVITAGANGLVAATGYAWEYQVIQ